MVPIARWVRIALAAVTLPLLTLASCPPDLACEIVQAAQVPLTLENHIFVVPANLNGHAIKLLLDTGARTSLLGEAVVQRLHLPRDPRSSTFIKGLTGSSDIQDARIESLSIDAAVLPIERLAVSSFGGNQPFDGILGLDILGRYDLDIDGPKRMLTLYHPRHCGSATPPWNEPTVPVSGFSVRTGWPKLPFKLDGTEGVGFLDTGASNTIITPKMAQRLGLTEQVLANDRMIRIHVVAGEATPSRVHWFSTVQIGPAVIQRPYAYVLEKQPPPFDGSETFPDGVIGVDVLGRQHLWISVGSGELYLARPDGG